MKLRQFEVLALSLVVLGGSFLVSGCGGASNTSVPAGREASREERRNKAIEDRKASTQGQ